MMSGRLASCLAAVGPALCKAQVPALSLWWFGVADVGPAYVFAGVRVDLYLFDLDVMLGHRV